MSNTRQQLRRQVKMASGNLDDALEHLLRVKETFKTEHPDNAELVERVMVLIAYVQEITNKLLESF